jgi:hypothetical protein
MDQGDIAGKGFFIPNQDLILENLLSHPLPVIIEGLFQVLPGKMVAGLPMQIKVGQNFMDRPAQHQGVRYILGLAFIQAAELLQQPAFQVVGNPGRR